MVSNFNKISSNFSKISDSLNKADLGKTAKNLEKTLANVDKMMANFVMAKIKQTAALLDTALMYYKEVIASGKSEFSAEAKYRQAQILFLQNLEKEKQDILAKSDQEKLNLQKDRDSQKLEEELKTLEVSDLDIEDMLLLEDGHCFRDGVINLCKSIKQTGESHFQLESGSIEMLVKLSNEGLGMTLLPYLNTLDLKDNEKENLRYFNEPSPAREVSIIYNKSELKIQIVEALQSVISGIIRGAIAFQNVQIISPLQK